MTTQQQQQQVFGNGMQVASQQQNMIVQPVHGQLRH